ncbi:hypothetical protein GALMADRAFT_217077 [Galerina marginata CBS 339.88]|uniref:Uncharacterized protein n=1 Tax=Galerina marginata (strain CBS 339.88) TaxID=685588 RepID=A0A067S669_GALM3|nr:hypothetical protein GALMADRAFT_217077 [Galerina marginata CBS 339.88]
MERKNMGKKERKDLKFMRRQRRLSSSHGTQSFIEIIIKLTVPEYPGAFGTLLLKPVQNTTWLIRNVRSEPSSFERDISFVGSWVLCGAGNGGGGPDVQLEGVGMGFEPIASWVGRWVLGRGEEGERNFNGAASRDIQPIPPCSDKQNPQSGISVQEGDKAFEVRVYDMGFPVLQVAAGRNMRLISGSGCCSTTRIFALPNRAVKKARTVSLEKMRMSHMIASSRARTCRTAIEVGETEVKGDGKRRTQNSDLSPVETRVLKKITPSGPLKAAVVKQNALGGGLKLVDQHSHITHTFTDRAPLGIRFSMFLVPILDDLIALHEGDHDWCRQKFGRKRFANISTAIMWWFDAYNILWKGRH